MNNRILIPLVALGILVLGVGFFSNLFFSPFDNPTENPHLPEDLLWPDDWISCAVLDEGMIGGNSPGDPPVISRNPLYPGDCVIWSLAYLNWKRNPIWDLTKWYNSIEECALKKGLYPMDPKLGGALPMGVEKLCKEPLSILAGMPENFSEVSSYYSGIDMSALNPNLIDCPPYGKGQMIILQLEEIIPVNDFIARALRGPHGHAMACEIVSCPADEDLPRTLKCMDRQNWVSGEIRGIVNEITIGSEGIVSSETMGQRFMTGWKLTSVHSIQ